jgi:hypothetical protein
LGMEASHLRPERMETFSHQRINPVQWARKGPTSWAYVVCPTLPYKSLFWYLLKSPHWSSSISTSLILIGPFLQTSAPATLWVPAHQLGRHLCQLRADWNPTKVTMVNWCSAGQLRLSLKKTAKLAQWVVSLFGYPDWGLLCFSSVVRQMPGYNLNGARPTFPSHGGLQPKWFPPPKSQRLSAKAISTLLGSTSRKPSNQNPFHSCLMG